ncbi:MAG: sporulation peptidase YabG [Clostridium sp.]|uniref:sporulation peptidase YabG n=2 Tax=Clostridium sp. TaxID=1506 RepID=UPI00303DDF90
MNIGDKVVRKSYDKDVIFKIIAIEENENGDVKYLLKGLNIRIEADSLEDDLETIDEGTIGEKDKVFNKKINTALKKVLMARNAPGANTGALKLTDIEIQRKERKGTALKTNELYFGRPGKILHIDGDPQYLEICLKTYKQLSIEAVGKVIAEKDQPIEILDLVKELNPDIVVITGHDGMAKDISNYMDLDNYRNSKYFVECVSMLRNYKSNYDDLVIFAGACQSNYEALLDAGANFASSPNRVLIHCLDPVFICEKVAYTNVEDMVNVEDAIQNTITGIKGVGGLQTRGKYRMGYPKSQYVK